MVGEVKDYSGDQLFFFYSCGSNRFPKKAVSDSEETSFLSQSMYFLPGTFTFASSTLELKI